ncbi:hypothetical protein HK405_015140, partial [Cladochytrium tenue]
MSPQSRTDFAANNIDSDNNDDELPDPRFWEEALPDISKRDTATGDNHDNSSNSEVRGKNGTKTNNNVSSGIHPDSNVSHVDVNDDQEIDLLPPEFRAFADLDR